MKQKLTTQEFIERSDALGLELQNVALELENASGAEYIALKDKEAEIWSRCLEFYREASSGQI